MNGVRIARASSQEDEGVLGVVQMRHIPFAFIILCGCANPTEDAPRVYVGIARQTMIAVVATSECANAYVTDGRADWVSYSRWFKSNASPAGASFSDDSMELSVSFEDLTGTLETQTSSYSFSLELADEPAGLYRGETTFGGVTYVGGWIFSGLGEQRGAVTASFGSDLLSSSLLSGPEQDVVTLMNGAILGVYRILEPNCPEEVTPPQNGGGSGASGGGSICCKTCGPMSQACGDSCIALGNTCSQPIGCACEG